MRILVLFSLMIWTTGVLNAAANADASQKEIVIVMEGEPTASGATVSIWQNDAASLNRLFAKKNKEQVLAAASEVSGREVSLAAQNGTQYVLVPYGTETRDYRKLLFEQAAPQKFVTCAANASDVIAVFEQYGVNVGLRQSEFVKTFPAVAAPQTLVDGSQTLTLYTLPAAQLPRPGKEPLYLAFQNNRLVKIMSGDDALAAYKKTLRPQPKAAAPTPAAPTKKPQQNQPYKALVSGGTLHDRMYMPHVIKRPTPMENTQSK